MSALDTLALDQLFATARTYNAWQKKPVPPELLRQLADLVKMAPTSANSSPARFVFVESPDAKDRLVPLVSEGNREKVRAAPVTAIVGYDLEFYEKLPFLMPHIDARSWFVGKPTHIETTAFRNSSLQGAYMIMAARALGLDTGAMSGFDNAAVDAAFFPGGTIKSNFLCNLGYGDPSGTYPRAPRFSFDEFCSIV